MTTKAELDCYFYNARIEAADRERERKMCLLLDVMDKRLARLVELLERAERRASGELADDL